jgi:hypothetical protein
VSYSHWNYSLSAHHLSQERLVVWQPRQYVFCYS